MKITVDAATFSELLANAEYAIQTMAPSQLEVHPRAQREIVPSRLESLVSNFNPALAGVITASHRAGKTLIVDGQHRWRAAGDPNVIEKFGNPEFDGEVPLNVTVFTGLSEEQEAQLFLGLNSTASVHVAEQFKAAVLAQYSNFVTVSNIVKEKGLQIARSGAQGTINAPSTLMSIYNWQPDGEVIVRRTLDVLTGSFSHAQGIRRNRSYSAGMLMATALVLFRYREVIEVDRLVGALKTKLSLNNPVQDLMEQARAHQNIHKGSLASNIAAVMVVLYNRTTKGYKTRDPLPDWKVNQRDDRRGLAGTTTTTDNTAEGEDD